MKILMFGNAKIKYMPYIHFYLENCNLEKNEVHVIYWNRDLKPEAIPFQDKVILHEFRWEQEDQVSRFLKIRSYAGLRNFAIKLIRREKFDKIIVLDSLPGVLILDKLKRNYKGKYIFDYRDSSYEGFSPFRKAIGTLAKYAAAVFVSSDGFRQFFPSEFEKKIFTSHNVLMDSLNHREDHEKYYVPSDKIRISFWGFLREENLNREIISRIGKDDRFELHFYGKEETTAIHLKKYVQAERIDNVFFHGEYSPEERYDFIKVTDLIHNFYDCQNSRLAMGNKYYDGVIFRIPQLCMQESVMGEMARRNTIGTEVDPKDQNFTDKIYDYYMSIEHEKFNHKCDDELDRILAEYEKGCSVVNNFCV